MKKVRDRLGIGYWISGIGHWASPSLMAFGRHSLSFGCHSIVIRLFTAHCPLRTSHRSLFTAEAPQYDLPDLRGKQRTQRVLLFLFFGEGPKNKKEHLPDYPFNLFTIRTIPSHITGTLHLNGYQVAGFFLSVLSTERKKYVSLRPLRLAVNTALCPPITDHWTLDIYHPNPTQSLSP